MDPRRRRRRVLSPEQKWQAWLEVVSGELTQADAARKYGVDVSVIIKIRKTAKDACLAAFAASQAWTVSAKNLYRELRRKPSARNLGAAIPIDRSTKPQL